MGCEQALLEANIPSHEKKCDEFQRVMAMAPADIVGHLKQKIAKFERNIHLYSSELLQADSAELNEHSLQMLEESRAILDSGQLSEPFEREYSSCLSVSRKWMLMTEEISRVNWFLRVRQKVKAAMCV